MTVDAANCERDVPPTVPTSTTDFDAWVSPHLPVLRALATRDAGTADADDVVQDALVRAWTRRATFDPARGSARAWLVAVLFDQLRRRRVRFKPLPALVPDAAVRAEDGSRLDLENLVRALPRRQREVVTLFYLADLPVEDVAAVLGIAVGSVKAHLAAARDSLRKTWEPS